jgi:hypothetical protein
MAIREKARTINPRSITDTEWRYLASWDKPETQAELVKHLMARKGPRYALAIPGYLTARAAGLPASVVSDGAKARYRKILAELIEDGLAPPPPGSKPPRMFDPVNQSQLGFFGEDGAGRWEQKPLLGAGIVALATRRTHVSATSRTPCRARGGHVHQPELAA